MAILVIEGMRILVVSNEFFPQVGGIQRLLHRLSEEMPAAGVLASPHAQSEIFDKGQRYPVFRVLPGPTDNFTRRFMKKIVGPEVALSFSNFSEILSTSKMMRPDVILVGHIGSLGIGIRLGRRLGVPISLFAYGLEIARPWLKRRGFARLAFKRMLLKTDFILAISRYTSELVKRWGVHSKRITIAPLGVDANRFAMGDGKLVREKYGLQNKIVLLTVGRLVRRKGHDTVIKALPEIAKTVPQIAYLVVGEGPERERLEQMIREIGMAKYVIFADSVDEDELLEYYAASDLFVMPCCEIPEEGDAEGFGLVFLEAAAAGVPSIAGLSGGAPEAVDEGKSGLLVPPNNPAVLAEIVINLLSDKNRLHFMANGARKWAVGHSWESMAISVRKALEGIRQ